MIRNGFSALEHLTLVSRGHPASRLPGQRLGTSPGTSREFVDYRPYDPGDDIRTIDWYLYARLRKPFVRRFYAETERAVHLLLDVSNSMRFGDPDKLTYAKTVVSALSYVGLRHQDRVALSTFSDRLHAVLPPRRGNLQWHAIQALLNRVTPSGVSDLNRAFTEYGARARSPGLLLILSDFFAAEGYEAGFRLLLARKFEPVVIHVLAEAEWHPPVTGHVILRDLERGTSTPLTVTDDTLRRYHDRMRSFTASLIDACRRYRMPYARTFASASLADMISQFLQAGVWQRRCTS